MMDNKKIFVAGQGLAQKSLVEYVTDVMEAAFQASADGKYKDFEEYLSILGDALGRSVNMELQAITGYLGVEL